LRITDFAQFFLHCFSRNSYCVVYCIVYCVVIGSAISADHSSRRFRAAIAAVVESFFLKRLRYSFRTVVTCAHADGGTHGAVSRAARMIRETQQLHPPAGDGSLHPQGVSK
jgi:hypothetical protein